MEQVAKGPKRYDIVDESMEVPYFIHKKIRLPNTIQGIDEPVDKEVKEVTKNQAIQSEDM
jgi:hypothetical protein